MDERLKWIWVNISNIHPKSGGNDVFIDGLHIKMFDCYFDCYFRLISGEIGYFRISLEYPQFGDTKHIFFNPDIPERNIDFYIENLKPIIREWKINHLV